MTSIILEGPIAEAREREVRLLYDIAENIAVPGEAWESDRSRLQENANDLRDMFFLVVVIGEFNAGKSTFVNALLGEEVLPMGITPTTEVIELIRFGRGGKGKKPEMREDGTLREWIHANTGAPGVSIVDTPGTGSVFQKHERVAKSFLSRSDLVIFVLSAKRAFAQTEKIYLELARDYGKKIILVINQIDLLEKKEQKTVENFVRQQVNETLNLEPPIFQVSAKQALKGEKSGGLFSSSSGMEGGMDKVREYLLEAFRQTPPAKQKLFAQLDFGSSMIKKYQEAVGSRLDLVSNDERQAKQLREELEKQAETLSGQLDTSMKELDRVFDQLRQRGRKFIADNLSFSGARMMRGADRQDVRQKFESEVVGSALQQINDISEDYVNAVVDSSRRYWRSIIDRLNKLEALIKEQIASPDASSYSDQRMALQEAIAIADSQLKSYTENNIAETLHETFSTNMSGFTFSVGGVVAGIIAGIFAIAAPGAVGATALSLGLSIVAAPAVLLGGGLAYGYWRKLHQDAYRELDHRLDELRASYRRALQDLTDRERSRLLQYGQQILAPVFGHLEVIAGDYRKQQTKLEALQKEADTLRQEIERIQIITK